MLRIRCLGHGRVAAADHPQPEVDQVCGVVPEQVVGPAALQPGGADVVQPVDEEPALHVADPLLAGPDPLHDGQPLHPVAHRVHHAEGQPALLGRGDHGLRALQVHRDRDLHQHVLALLQRGQRHLGVRLAGTRDDHDVDLGVGDRLVEVGGPLRVAVLLGEHLGRGGLAADRRGRPLRHPGFLGRPTTVCSRQSSTPRSASECQIPIIPWPTMQTFSIADSLPGVSRGTG